MNFKSFRKDAIVAIKAHPSLQLVDAGDSVHIGGSLPVDDTDGKRWDVYQLEIHCSTLYPRMFPIVYETGGAIRRIPDWHINNDGSACLDNEYSQLIKCYEGMTVKEFIERELIPWLANQSHRRQFGYYVNGEQGHGDIGRIEFFMKELRAPNLLTCVAWMHRIACKSLPNPGVPCLCGSGIKWRVCHKAAFDRLALIPEMCLRAVVKTFHGYVKAGASTLAVLQERTSVNLI